MTAADLKNIKQMIREVVEEEINKKIVGKIYTIDDLNKAIKEEREALVETNLEQEITRILNSRGKAESVLDFGNRIHKQLADKLQQKPLSRFARSGRDWNLAESVAVEDKVKIIVVELSKSLQRSQLSILYRIAKFLKDDGVHGL